MIDKSLVVSIHDSRLKSLLSQRGCFPVDSLNSKENFINVNDGLTPNLSEDFYRVCDIVKTLSNLRRYNFIELIWGVPDEVKFNHRTLF